MAAPFDPADSDAELMTRYGITCVSVPDHYQYKSWRYTRLVDAVAQAKRDRAAADGAG